MFTNESNFKNVSRQGRKGFLGELCVFAYRDVGEGREQAVPAHPCAHGICTSVYGNAEALRENVFSYPASLRFSLARFYMVNP